MKHYLPVGNRILIKKIQIEEKTKSGIILNVDVETEQRKNTFAEVLDIGRKVDKTLGLKVGDKIAFVKFSESVLNEEEQIATIKDENVQAIIKESKWH